MSAPVGVWNTPNIAEECVSNGVKGGQPKAYKLPFVGKKWEGPESWTWLV